MTQLSRWAGDQVVGTLFGAALGSSLVIGIATAALGYLQNLPLAWMLFSATGATGFTALALNNIRAFKMATSVTDKFPWVSFNAGPAENALKGYKGTGIGVVFANIADVPLEFKVERYEAQLGGRAIIRGERDADGVVPPGQTAQILIGTVPEPPPLPASQIVQGRLDLEVSYGRLGKRKHRHKFLLRLAVQTDSEGQAIGCSVYGDER